MMMMMSSVAPVEEDAAMRRRGRRRSSRRRSESRVSGSEESGSVGVAENEENAAASFGSVSHKKQQLQGSLNAAGSACEADNSMCGSDDDRSGTTTTTVVLREQDYIGLSSEVSSSSSPSPLPSSSSCFRTVRRSPSCSKESEKGVVREEELNLNLGATELRLGPRPRHQESGRCAENGREPMTCSTDELDPFAAAGLDKAQASSQKPAAAAASDRVVAAAASADRARTTTGSFRSFPNSEKWNGEELQREQQQGCDETLNLGISLVPNNRGCNRSEQVAAAADKKKLFHVSEGSAAMEEDNNNINNNTKQSRSNQQQGNPPPPLQQHLQEAPPQQQQQQQETEESMLVGRGETGENNGHYRLGGPQQHQQHPHVPHSCCCCCPHEAAVVEGSRAISAVPPPPPPSHTSSSSSSVAAAGNTRSRFPYNGTEMVAQKPKQLGAQQYPSPNIIYPCNMKPLLPPLPTSSSSSWQQQQLQTREQPGGLFGTFHPQPQLAASRGPLPQLMSNRATDASADANPKTWDSFSSSSLPPKKLEEASFTAVASSEFAKHPSPNKQPPATAVKEAAAPTTAPPRQAPVVVGWPPVRNFRRNALAFQQQPPRSAPPSSQERQPRPTTTTNPLVPTSVGMMTPPTPPANGGATPSQTSFLVKVYMDGLPIGRKVDLTTHNSYDKLKYALEDMFQQFIGQPIGGPQSFTGGNTGVSSSTCSRKLNFLHNSDYVLTYEDCDSDHMLVGDVPWEMFTTIVRRLRIMKGVDIAQRGGDDTMSSQLDVV
ncbi:hypothetical protein CY35_03G085300 [Sphagnum magellanicum]|nr:hypothetical protein CY35_03G085300 [Sphagnum magellanicum]